MGGIGNEVLGLAFLGVAGALVLLMFKVWGYPYDKATNKSTAPASLVRTHRLLGYIYVAIYVYLMWEMVPRMWTYQIELPARTVAHLCLGIAIGGILIVKLSIVRFFKHMEATLVPLLGTALFICTLVLAGLALPLQFREAYLRDSALMGDTFSEERIARVREQLPKTGLDDPARLETLATSEALLDGRRVLIEKCVQCHDLRTVLARPRTPEAWRQTVKRMAERSATALFPISDDEEWEVTAYLVAISPTLQSTLRDKRKLDTINAMAQQAATMTGQKLMMEEMDMEAFDSAAAKEVFETKCSQCHAWQQVEWIPPVSKKAAVELVQRMVRNGLVASDNELADIVRYVNVTYVPADEMSPDTVSPDVDPDNPDYENPDDENPDEASSDEASSDASGTASSGPVDNVLIVNPLGSDLRFEQSELIATAGSRVRLVFNNTSGLEHNFVLVSSEEISDDVVTESYGAVDRGFLPEHADIIAGIPSVSPGSSGEVEFEVPESGKYRFVCLFPGHNFTMKGTLSSVE